MENSITVRTPAKINLTLDIVGKRTDGYHFMKTIYQAVDLHDTVTVQLREDEKIDVVCDRPQVPHGESNLVYKAALAFFEYTGVPFNGMGISIEKNIPLQAGLAGGSSNAAGVLVALNELFKTRLPLHQLCEIGVKLGADVPFCLTGGTALAEGIGDILLPLPNCPECYIVLAKGTQGISTAEAFQKYDRLLIPRHPDTDEMIAAIAVGDVPRIAELCLNVLESAADLEEIGQLKNILLENGALCAHMTGSGSAVFGIFEKKKQAAACLDELKDAADFAELCEPVETGIQIR